MTMQIHRCDTSDGCAKHTTLSGSAALRFVLMCTLSPLLGTYVYTYTSCVYMSTIAHNSVVFLLHDNMDLEACTTVAFGLSHVLEII